MNEDQIAMNVKASHNYSPCVQECVKTTLFRHPQSITHSKKSRLRALCAERLGCTPKKTDSPCMPGENSTFLRDSIFQKQSSSTSPCRAVWVLLHSAVLLSAICTVYSKTGRLTEIRCPLNGEPNTVGYLHYLNSLSL